MKEPWYMALVRSMESAGASTRLQTSSLLQCTWDKLRDKYCKPKELFLVMTQK